jgi:MYXO-CTERM domain-containing protein
LTPRLPVPLLVSVILIAAAPPFLAPPALAATATSFTRPSVNLAAGQSTTITIAAVGLTAGDAAAQFGIVHNAANTRIANLQCAGVFAGASPLQQAVGFGDLLACVFITGGASGTTGNIMTFALTNTGGATETITFNSPGQTFYLGNDNTFESPGSLNSLVMTHLRTATPTATPRCILGDINCDGIVDVRDYGLWRQHFGEGAGAAALSARTGAALIGDLNGDGIVDIRDYSIWRANFGHTAGAALRGETAPAPRGTPGPVLLSGDQAAAVSSSPLPADGAGPAVPVVPLVGGLLGLGGLAGWRRRHPPGRS